MSTTSGVWAKAAVALRRRAATKSKKTQERVRTGIGIALRLRVRTPGREDPRPAWRTIKSPIECRVSQVETVVVKTLSSNPISIPRMGFDSQPVQKFASDRNPVRSLSAAEAHPWYNLVARRQWHI